MKRVKTKNKIIQMLNSVFEQYTVTKFEIYFGGYITLDVIKQEGDDSIIVYSAKEIEHYCMQSFLKKGYIFKISRKKIKVFKNKKKIFETENCERDVRQSLEMYLRIYDMVCALNEKQKANQ